MLRLGSFRHRLDCEVLAREAEIARIDHAFDEAILEAPRSLSEQNLESRSELVVDAYDLSQSKARVESYGRRARDCQRELAE